MSDVERKALAGPFQIKDEVKGEVEAIVATIRDEAGRLIIDHQGDAYADQPIENGVKVVLSQYGHDVAGGLFGGGAMPAGKGAMFVERGKIVVRAKAFLTTERGREMLEMLKAMGADQPWSYGYEVISEERPNEELRQRGARRKLTKIRPFEASPVPLAAGIGTRTVSAKGAAAPAVDEEVRRFARLQAAAAALDERYGALALDVAAKAIRWLSRGRVQSPPLLKFYDGEAGGPRGFWDPTRPDVIYLKRDLSAEEIVFVVGHECAHLLYGRGEEGANLWGEYVLATYRETIS